MRANDRNRARIVVLLLFMFMVINFADKAVIGIAAVPIMQELRLGPRSRAQPACSHPISWAVSSRAPRHRSTGSTPASSCAGSSCWWAAPSPWGS
jgi:hypothetical protein